MKIWKDAEGHAYETKITVAEIRDVKTELGINLMEPEQGKQGKRDEQVHCQGDILPRKKH